MESFLVIDSYKIPILRAVLNYEGTNDLSTFFAVTLATDDTVDYNELIQFLTKTVGSYNEIKLVVKNRVVETYHDYFFSTLTLNHEEDGRQEMVLSLRKSYLEIYEDDITKTVTL